VNPNLTMSEYPIPANKAEVSQAKVANVEANKADILIVDDHPANLRLLSAMLEKRGYQVRKALDGQTALNLVELALPDIVLLDINMPQMSGYEVCSRLKAAAQTRDLPVIFLSASSEALNKVHAFEVGGADYITKPFQLEDVLIRVENQLTIQQQKQQLTEQNIQLQREIYDRQHAEAALRRSEVRNRAVLSAIPDLMFRVRKDGTYLDYFPAKGFHEPLSPGVERVGKQMSEVIPIDIARRQQQYMELVLQTGEIEVYEQQFEVDGKLYEEEVRVVVSGEDEVLFIIRDISDRRRIERALYDAQRKSETLLLNILPKVIADQLKKNQDSVAEGNGAIAQQFSEATILFADIVDFTSQAARTRPTDLVSLLNQIFSTFDQLVEQHGLEKIKTIGDAYMAVGGLPIPRTDHTEAIADLALDMQQAIQRFQRDNGKPFQLRIGINTGAVVAGVIGIKKFSYDLWGDTVNVASRMETQGEAGKIQVTAATYQRLKHSYQFEERGAIAVKGKGEMTTYWLLGKADGDEPLVVNPTLTAQIN
jgi:adenylate cyclase